jgi:Flp pilus assembly pilin Flp
MANDQADGSNPDSTAPNITAATEDELSPQQLAQVSGGANAIEYGLISALTAQTLTTALAQVPQNLLGQQAKLPNLLTKSK